MSKSETPTGDELTFAYYNKIPFSFWLRLPHFLTILSIVDEVIEVTQNTTKFSTYHSGYKIYSLGGGRVEQQK